MILYRVIICLGLFSDEIIKQYAVTCIGGCIDTAESGHNGALQRVYDHNGQRDNTALTDLPVDGDTLPRHFN